MVARRIRDAIVSGELEVGSTLPSEAMLCERLGVGRSTVREAIRVLQAQGLLTGGDRVSTRRPIVGGDVVPRAAEALHTVLALGALPSSDLVELRLLLETAVLERVASPAPDHDPAARAAALDEARQALTDAEAAGTDLCAFRTADLAFHEALVRASGNRAFALVMSVLREAMESTLYTALLEHDPATIGTQLDQLRAEHRSILAAIDAGAPEQASALLHDHLEQFYREHP